MKIGIYGGTFNPPHLGHMAAAQAAMAVLGLDKLFFIPAALPPHKELPADGAGAEHRLAMTALMADGLGLGSCWVQGRLREAADGRSTEDFVRSLLGFPEHLRLEAILTLGIPAQHPEPHRLEELPLEKIHREKF